MKRVVRPKIEAKNPYHNLWKNNNIWWLHYTAHYPDYTKKRVWYSLGTRDKDHARILRDMIFHDLNIKNADENK